MRLVQVGLFIIFVESAACDACSRSNSNASSNSTTNSAAPAASATQAAAPSNTGPCKKYKACEVLTLNDVNAALGSHLSSPGTEVGAALPNASGCTYSDAHQHPFNMLISCEPESTKDWARSFAMAKKGIEIGGHTVTTLSGLGNEPAFWGVPSDKNDKIKGYQIEVFFGASSLFLLTFRPALGDDAEALAAGRRLATTALARL